MNAGARSSSWNAAAQGPPCPQTRSRRGGEAHRRHCKRQRQCGEREGKPSSRIGHHLCRVAPVTPVKADILWELPEPDATSTVCDEQRMRSASSRAPSDRTNRAGAIPKSVPSLGRTRALLDVDTTGNSHRIENWPETQRPGLHLCPFEGVVECLMHAYVTIHAFNNRRHAPERSSWRRSFHIHSCICRQGPSVPFI
jgi:hypothetical protein